MELQSFLSNSYNQAKKILTSEEIEKLYQNQLSTTNQYFQLLGFYIDKINKDYYVFDEDHNPRYKIKQNGHHFSIDVKEQSYNYSNYIKNPLPLLTYNHWVYEGKGENILEVKKLHQNNLISLIYHGSALYVSVSNKESNEMNIAISNRQNREYRNLAEYERKNGDKDYGFYIASGTELKKKIILIKNILEQMDLYVHNRSDFLTNRNSISTEESKTTKHRQKTLHKNVQPKK